MSITSMTFLFCFLPLSLLIYYAANDKMKNYVLVAASLTFYAIGSLDYFILFMAALIVNICLGRRIDKSNSIIIKRLLLITGIFLNTGLLAYYKYKDFALVTWGNITSTDIQLKKLILPLGISFFTFKAISYLVDIYLGKAHLSNNSIHDALYLSFFAQIQSGPLTRISDFKNDSLKDRKVLFEHGVSRFIIGFNKKVLIANILASITSEIFSTPFEQFSTGYAWLGAICYSMQLFLDFAGYSDMAIGLSEMFGFKCMENFNFPYMTESISKFWRRWHISLSEWFRDYVYIPLGGSINKKPWRVYFNLFLVWALTGIWHGSSWNFVVWGIGYFVFITFEKASGVPDRFKSNLGKIIYRIFSLLFINFQWVLFRSENLISGFRYIKRMILPYHNELSNMRTIFLIKDYAFFIIAALILCFPIVNFLDEKFRDKEKIHFVFNVAINLIIICAFIWSISFVVSGQNNPFAYANF